MLCSRHGAFSCLLAAVQSASRSIDEPDHDASSISAERVERQHREASMESWAARCVLAALAGPGFEGLRTCPSLRHVVCCDCLLWEQIGSSDACGGVVRGGRGAPDVVSTCHIENPSFRLSARASVFELTDVALACCNNHRAMLLCFDVGQITMDVLATVGIGIDMMGE